MTALNQARVLISGGGGGLGRALCRQLAQSGARLCISDRRLEAAEQTLSQLQASGGEGFAVELDVTREADFSSAIEQMQKRWGGIDILINNAGVASAGTVADAPLEQWQAVLDINLLGYVRGCRVAIPALRQSPSAHIVNIASFAGIANPPAMASYNAAKAAVISLSESLRFELDPDIAVTVACPAFFQTDLLATSEAQLGETAAGAAPQMKAVMNKMMQRAPLSADDVAESILGAVEENRFLVIPHPDARQQTWLKRASPEWYFRSVRKSLAAFLKT
ncbi:MAG: SDR family NAD(P)-dependent oxidoreductase [Panacagrimonas sp.]